MDLNEPVLVFSSRKFCFLQPIQACASCGFRHPKFAAATGWACNTFAEAARGFLHCKQACNHSTSLASTTIPVCDVADSLEQISCFTFKLANIRDLSTVVQPSDSLRTMLGAEGPSSTKQALVFFGGITLGIAVASGAAYGLARHYPVAPIVQDKPREPNAAAIASLRTRRRRYAS